VRRWGLRIALIVTAVVGVAPSGASATVYETAPSFCQGAVLVDYLAPLKRMPKLRAPSPDGLAGLGHSNLLLQSSPRLIVGGGQLEYWLSTGGSDRPARLGWTLTATLARVNQRGRAVERVGRARRHVVAVTKSSLPGARFELDAEPAMYRLLVAIQDEDGKTLGQYGFYHRVVVPTQEVRLGLNASSYAHEQTVFARVENLGTERVSYGAGYAIQRLEGSRWVTAPESPRRFIKPLYSTPAGASGRCHKFWIPPTMPPGRYRISKGVFFDTDFDSVDFPPARARLLTAEFDIQP
jgi:Bacterial Ig-like domain